MSLDGYIAGPQGEADWIIRDPEIDFGELWAQFDTLLMGRRTYQAAVARLGASTLQDRKAVVASRTLRAEDHPGVRVIPEVTPEEIQTLRREGAKEGAKQEADQEAKQRAKREAKQGARDIWLFGGGELAAALLRMGEVDTVEVSIIPVLLGAGVPLGADLAQRTMLKLTEHRVYRSGIVSLKYDVQK
jgi:dihydrofolate reductase